MYINAQQIEEYELANFIKNKLEHAKKELDVLKSLQ